MRRAELSGKRFGRLVVVAAHSVAESPCGTKRLKWLCRCDCGGEKVVRGADLTNGLVRSCGCLLSETTRARMTTHGQSRRGRTTPEYTSWAHAKKRCSNPDDAAFKDYGGRGIRMCEEWANSFEAFFRDMGPRPKGRSLDRIDVNGHYEPSNCRWATRREQHNNMRTSRYVVVGSERLTVAEASRRAGMAAYVVYSRLKLGWSIERALSDPVKK